MKSQIATMSEQVTALRHYIHFLLKKNKVSAWKSRKIKIKYCNLSRIALDNKNVCCEDSTFTFVIEIMV